MNKVRDLFPPKQKPVLRDQLVTIADLQEFKTDLLLAIKQMLTESKPQDDKKWLKSYQVKELLGISSGTLQTLRSNGSLPFSKVGGIIYYDRDDINKFISERRRDFSSVFGTSKVLKIHA